MDKQQRGILLVDKEETEKEVASLQKELKHMGQLLAEFGERLASSPEKITFSNAPSPLGDIPISLMTSNSFDWNSIPDKTVIAQKIQELRGIQDKLSNIQGLIGV
jgi:hypothetical protein